MLHAACLLVLVKYPYTVVVWLQLANRVVGVVCLTGRVCCRPVSRALVVYGSMEAEPIAMVFAAEKLRAEATGLEGMCVGLPAFPGSVKIVRPLRDVGMERESPLPPSLTLPPSPSLPAPPLEPLDIAAELEVGCGEVGEILLSGWHVNTYQVPRPFLSLEPVFS